MIAILWIIAVGCGIGACISFRKQRFETEKNYWKMRYAMEEKQKEKAQQDMTRSRYGK